ncbi:MAG: 50S ribosomal protein L30 [Eggerthellaceae bacterium]|nr:50S ribosomal protein L30 [Eggerthellaceae bacterium]
MARKLRITQMRSTVSCQKDQGRTIKALGLGKIRKSVELPDNECVRGMLFKVNHLVEWEEI